MLDAAVAIAKDAVKKKIKPDSLSEKSLNKVPIKPLILLQELRYKQDKY